MQNSRHSSLPRNPRGVPIPAVIGEMWTMAHTVPVTRATRGTPDGHPIGERHMAEDIRWGRRRFLGTTALAMVAAQLGGIGSAVPHSYPWKGTCLRSAARRVAQSAAMTTGGTARESRPRRFLDLHLHQLAAHAALCPSMGCEIQDGGLVVSACIRLSSDSRKTSRMFAER